MPPPCMLSMLYHFLAKDQASRVICALNITAVSYFTSVPLFMCVCVCVCVVCVYVE